MVGEKYGRLTVIREKPISEYPNHKRCCVQWYCNCDCGTKDVLVDGTQLRRGHVQSCGCYNREMSSKKNTIDISGNKYGKLTVIKKVPKPKNKLIRGSWWLCNCECGNEVIVRGNALKTGNTVSCGCSNSKGELAIRNILNTNNIKFHTQYTFDDCVSETGAKLRFDFCIFQDDNKTISHLIEFQGRQHYEETNFFKNNLQEQKTLDEIKRKYCKNNNIPLLIIPYWEQNNITIKDLLLNSRFQEEMKNEESFDYC